MKNAVLEPRETTDFILADLERKPEFLSSLVEDPAAMYTAVSGLIYSVAPNFVFPDEPAGYGQIAQGLTDWHRDLMEHCSEQYSFLTDDPDGPQLSKEAANASPELQLLQAIKQGVKLARDSYSVLAKKHRTSGRPNLRTLRLPLDFIDQTSDLS